MSNGELIGILTKHRSDFEDLFSMNDDNQLVTVHPNNVKGSLQQDI